MNKIILSGNVVHTPEQRTTASGVNVTKFSIAVKRRFKNAQGEYETDFFEVQAWRQLGDLCMRYIEKGKKVLVTGSMQSREYESRDGGKCRAWEIVADEVEFLSPKSDGETAAPQKAQIPKSNTNGYDPAEEGFTVAEDDELPF